MNLSKSEELLKKERMALAGKRMIFFYLSLTLRLINDRRKTTNYSVTLLWRGKCAVVYLEQKYKRNKTKDYMKETHTNTYNVKCLFLFGANAKNMLTLKMKESKEYY